MHERKRKPLFHAIIVSIILLTVGSVIFVKMMKGHKENYRVIEQCFERFDKDIVIVKESFGSAIACSEN